MLADRDANSAALSGETGQTVGVAVGIVKFFKAEKGWGAISSDDLPDGEDAFAHFSSIEMDGYRELDAGELVDFDYDYEPTVQDSFRWIATSVRRRSRD